MTGRLPLLAVALCLAACGRAERSTAATSASSAPPSASAAAPGRYVGVPQRELAAVPFLFHPTLPVAGQIINDGCDLWDLDLGVTRGRVPRAECAAWPPSRDAGRRAPLEKLPAGIDPSARWFVDPAGRHAGFSSESWSSEWSILHGIVSLADARLVVSTPRRRSSRHENNVVAVWAPDGTAFFKVTGPDLATLPTLTDESDLTIRFADLRLGSLRTLPLRDGALERAAVSPDGRCLAFATLELGPTLTARDATSPIPRERRPKVRLWCPDRGSDVAWTLARESEDLVWSARSDAVAIVGSGGTWHMGLAEGRPPPDTSALAGRPRPGSRAVGELGVQDPSGRFEVFRGEDAAVLRRADGELLRIDARGLATDGYLFSREPPREWVFRDGPDALRGRLMRAANAPFLAPTLDLGARFLAGEALPRPHAERPPAR
jgi:hypothetical protein